MTNVEQLVSYFYTYRKYFGCRAGWET